MNKRFTVAIVLAMGLATTPLLAASETHARAAVAEARGKIEANDKSGAGAGATDAQNRARAALDRAEKAIRDDKEDRALHEAAAASALADLAQATAELNAITAERDKIATR